MFIKNGKIVTIYFGKLIISSNCDTIFNANRHKNRERQTNMKNNLKSIRKSKTDLTQVDAAKQLDMSLETYRSWEQGKVQLNARQLKLLADFYSCTIDDICMVEETVAEKKMPSDPELERLTFVYNHISEAGRDALMATAEGLYARYAVKNNPISNRPDHALTA